MKEDDRRTKGESSRFKRAKRRERVKIRGTASVFGGTLALSLLFCGHWILSWTDGLSQPLARRILLPLASGLAKPGEVLGIPLLAHAGRALFLSWADPDAAGQEKARLARAEDEAGPGGLSLITADSEAMLPSDSPEDGAGIAFEEAALPEEREPEERPGSNRIMSQASSPPMEPLPPLSPIANSYRNRDPKPVFSPYRPLQVLMVGDSLIGQNTQDAMSEWDRKTSWAEVSYSWKLSTTLVDPSRLDWQARIRELTAEKAWDLIIVVIGSNDGQEIRKGERRHLFNTPDWVNLYDCRLRDFLSVITDRSLMVYWTAVPPMRRSGYRDRMAMLNGHVRSLVEEFPRTRWLDTAPILGNAEGRYTDAKIIDGVQRIIRMADGIHVTVPGAELLAQAWEEMMLQDFLVLRLD